MSWELDYEKKYPCPCGKGEYQVSRYSDDWGKFEHRNTMLCHICKDKYVYDESIIGGHPGNERVRGWVLKSVLESK